MGLFNFDKATSTSNEEGKLSQFARAVEYTECFSAER